ncbi:MAG: hypothetical protein M3155_07385 [Actinomycetota bacterium]|nr:hypothetical protein [Actinomycetota bacterium]
MREAYRIHFADPRRERMFVSSGSFLATFAVVRAITHAVKSDKVPIGNIQSGGRHIHHVVFGIAGLLGTGYAWTAQLGTGTTASGRAGSRATAASYGAASALTLDEFALWLNMDENDYWNSEGRKSVDAVVLFAALLSLGTWGAPFFQHLAGQHRPRR